MKRNLKLFARLLLACCTAPSWAVGGSMSPAERLPMLKSALKM